MSTQVQIRGAITATQSARTLAVRELDIDTTLKRLNVHDGSTAGGIPHANYVDIQNQTWSYGAASGTDTITVSMAKAPASYTAGQAFVFKAANTNTGSATLNVNSLGAKTLKKKNVSAGTISTLSAGDIIAGGMYTAIYDGTDMILDSVDSTSTTPALVKLSSQTASASASINFTSLITSTYDHYKFILEDIRVATDSTDLNMRLSTNNGSSYLTSYSGVYQEVVSAGTATAASSPGTYMLLSDTQGNAANEAYCGEVLLLNPNSTVNSKVALHRGGYLKHLAGETYIHGMNSYIAATTAVNACQFRSSSGNLTSGRITMYGILAP